MSQPLNKTIKLKHQNQLGQYIYKVTRAKHVFSVNTSKSIDISRASGPDKFSLADAFIVYWGQVEAIVLPDIPKVGMWRTLRQSE